MQCPQLLRRLRRLRQVVERGNDVLGKRIGERELSCGLRRSPIRQGGSAGNPSDGLSTRMPGRRPNFREHRHREAGEHGGATAPALALV